MTTDAATLDLTLALISRKSVTPMDAGCQQMMAERLEAIGFEVTHLRFDDVDNFWAIRGDSGPLLVFAGHTDVVPEGDTSEWHSDPYEPHIKDGVLFGRGAADMKTSLAAMVVACEEFVASHPTHSGRIGFLITSDEEGIATNGTVKVVQWLQQREQQITWCIVGEPSSTDTLGDIIKNGRRGSLGCELSVKGIQGHVAYPHLARNPIHDAMPALAELTQTTWDNGNDYFQPTSLQVSNFNSGTGATNVIPGFANVVFNFRFSTETTPEQLQQKTQAILDKHQLDYSIKWNLSGMPFLTEVGKLTEATQQAIKTITGTDAKLSTGGGTSDGRFIAPTGAQVIELGPINATIHKVNEQVKVADIGPLAAIYRTILVNLFVAP